MKKCQRECVDKKTNLPRIGSVTAKCSDMFHITIGDKEHDGYVPKDIGIGDKYGDYVEFDYCLECGQIQGKFPVKRTALEAGREE